MKSSRLSVHNTSRQQESRRAKSLRKPFRDFYNSVVVPYALAESLDPVRLFETIITRVAKDVRQDRLDEHRSSFFTIQS